MRKTSIHKQANIDFLISAHNPHILAAHVAESESPDVPHPYSEISPLEIHAVQSLKVK